MSTIAERLRLLRRDAGLVHGGPGESVTSPNGLPPLSVIPAQAGLRRQDAVANIRIANSLKGKPQERRVIQFESPRRKPGPGMRRDDPRKQDGTHRTDDLRKLIRMREQSRHIRLQPPAGIELAHGVHFVETMLKYEATATLDLPAINEQPIDRRRLLCFDTETTGLSGGVGTRAFMIGVAAWEDGTLTVRQLYLTAIAGEHAMLEIFAGWINPETILVSYNGKSYDAPLLKGRLRLNRVAHRLAELPHIDWLHPTRRVYKNSLPNCKLATIEREVLRIVREDDLPGSEAPAAWLAYLRGQSSINLARVLEHNRQDVVTLMRLGDHLTAL